jgi:hypothetical protein
LFVSLFRIPDPPPAPSGTAARPSMLHAIGEGLRAVRNDKPLLWLMVVFATINICVAGPVGVGLASVAKFRFGSAAAFGTFLSAFSGGTLAGLFLGGLVKRPRHRGLQFTAMSILTGLELIGIGLVYRFAAIAALLAVMGLGVGFVNVQFSAWIQLRPDVLPGRPTPHLLRDRRPPRAMAPTRPLPLRRHRPHHHLRPRDDGQGRPRDRLRGGPDRSVSGTLRPRSDPYFFVLLIRHRRRADL